MLDLLNQSFQWMRPFFCIVINQVPCVLLNCFQLWGGNSGLLRDFSPIEAQKLTKLLFNDKNVQTIPSWKTFEFGQIGTSEMSHQRACVPWPIFAYYTFRRRPLLGASMQDAPASNSEINSLLVCISRS